MHHIYLHVADQGLALSLTLIKGIEGTKYRMALTWVHVAATL
jgi:hypothetical protein